MRPPATMFASNHDMEANTMCIMGIWRTVSINLESLTVINCWNAPPAHSFSGSGDPRNRRAPGGVREAHKADTKEFLPWSLHFCYAAASTTDLDNKLMVNKFVHTILSGAGELPGTHHRLSSASVAAPAQHNNSPGPVRLHIPLKP